MKAASRLFDYAPRRLHLVVVGLAALTVASLVYQQRIVSRFLEERLLQTSSQAVLATLGHLEADLVFAEESARRLTTLFGQVSYSKRLVDAWALPLTNGEVIFYPDAPSFIFNAGRDTDYRPTTWVQLASPATNPLGEPRWTKASFDPVANAWMVSVVAPYFEDGVWAGTVGHDMLLSELFTALVVESQIGSHGLLPLYVVRSNGELLLKDVAMPGQGEQIPARYASLLDKADRSGLVVKTMGEDFYLLAPIRALDATVIYRISGAMTP